MAVAAALVQHRGQVLSTAQLLEPAWNDPIGVSSDRVKLAVLRLRRKLGRAGASIQDVRGFGYAAGVVLTAPAAVLAVLAFGHSAALPRRPHLDASLDPLHSGDVLRRAWLRAPLGFVRLI